MAIDPELNPFEVLNISPNTSKRGIKKAYRKLAKKLHPDKNPDDPNASQKFQDLTTAYERALALAESRKKHKVNIPKVDPTIYEKRSYSKDLSHFERWARNRMIAYILIPIIFIPVMIIIVYFSNVAESKKDVPSKNCSKCYHTGYYSNELDEDFLPIPIEANIWTYKYLAPDQPKNAGDMKNQKNCRAQRELDPVCF